MSQVAIKYENMNRPNVFEYISYREFLQTWFDYLREVKPKFSLRWLSLKTQVSTSYFPMILSGKRSLSTKQLFQIKDEMEMSESEFKFLSLLRDLTEAKSDKEREKAFSGMIRFDSYRNLYGNDITMHDYLSNWRHVIIREMALMKDFQPDTNWIRKRFKSNVPKSEVQKSLDFLFNNGFLEKDKEGKVIPPKRKIVCKPGVMKLAMSQAHENVLKLAKESIYNTPSKERRLVTYSLAIEKEDFDEVNDIIQEALDKIGKVQERSQSPNSVYQVSLLAFPVAGVPVKQGGES